MDEPKDILACPFCGTFALPLEVSRTANAANYQQWCHHCGALGPKRESVETAHEAWNRRAGGLERRTTACSQSCSIDWMDAGDKLATAIEGIRMILYGLSLDLRQAIIAQRAIDKAKDALASWREKKASNGVFSDPHQP